MRVSDDRYSRDRQRFDLALRLIRHEARTHTIREWTGLSGDRIRKLYRSYCLHDATGAVTRHRGKSPGQPAFFFRDPEVNFQAAQLASLYLLFDLIISCNGLIVSVFQKGTLESGVLLCRAYEEYKRLHAPAKISFEHAWFLLLALARRDEVGLCRCEACGGIWLRDLLARRRAPCHNCGPEGTGFPRHSSSTNF